MGKGFVERVNEKERMYGIEGVDYRRKCKTSESIAMGRVYSGKIGLQHVLDEGSLDQSLVGEIHASSFHVLEWADERNRKCFF